MNSRRGFLIAAVGLGFASTPAFGELLRYRKFAFRIKTQDGNLVSNLLIEAKDVEAAKVKLRKRYPDCQILDVEER